MARYRKRPVVIDAVEWTGANLDEVKAFAGDAVEYVPRHGLIVHTLEGDFDAALGDMIIRGVKGEFYPCKPDIFELTYEPVEA